MPIALIKSDVLVFSKFTVNAVTNVILLLSPLLRTSKANMISVSFLIEFCEHVPVTEVETMAYDLRYWAPDLKRLAERTYLVTVVRENKIALFKSKLAYGEKAGWWQWRPSPTQ